MAGMMQFVKRKVPPVGPDDDPEKRIGGNETAPALPDRDGPSKRELKSPKVHQAKPPAPDKKKRMPGMPKMKGVDIAGMRASLKKS